MGGRAGRLGTSRPGMAGMSVTTPGRLPPCNARLPSFSGRDQPKSVSSVLHRSSQASRRAILSSTCSSSCKVLSCNSRIWFCRPASSRWLASSPGCCCVSHRDRGRTCCPRGVHCVPASLSTPARSSLMRSSCRSSTDSCAVMSGGFSKEPALLAPLERRERERRRELRDQLPLCLRTELSSSGTKSPAAVAGRRRWGL